jgi:large subunit ribosomal protein L32e
MLLREKINRKRPLFRQQESWRYKRLKNRWKKPFGVDNKMRKKVKGWPKYVEVGYRGPKMTRGLHPSGYEEVLIRTLDDVDDINSKTKAIRIYHTVGNRKRVEILEKTRERKIQVLNSKRVIEIREKGETKETSEEQLSKKNKNSLGDEQG